MELDAGMTSDKMDTSFCGAAFSIGHAAAPPGALDLEGCPRTLHRHFERSVEKLDHRGLA